MSEKTDIPLLDGQDYKEMLGSEPIRSSGWNTSGEEMAQVMDRKNSGMAPTYCPVNKQACLQFNLEGVLSPFNNSVVK